MKKILICGLMMSLLVSLFGCMAETEPKQEEEKALFQTEDSQTENKQEEASKPQQEEKKPEQEAIEEMVLIEDQGVKITAKSLEKDSIFGHELLVLIENNTEKNLTVQTRNSCINGYMVDTLFSSDVAAGKKTNDDITFSSTDMELCGIQTVADIELSFHIIDADSWDTYLETPSVRIETTAAEEYEYAFDDSGVEMYQGNGIRIVGKGSLNDPIFGPSLVLFIENTSEQPITVQTRDTSVNGFMVDAMLSEDVLPGKRAVADANFLDLEKNDITEDEITEVEVSFHIFNSNTWDTIEDTGAFTLYMK